jgi:adenylyl-sulfate kinase
MIVDRDEKHELVQLGQAGRGTIVPSVGKVSAPERAALLGQRPVTAWLTGLSAAGKSTLASELEKRLFEARRPCYMLDGDNIRAGISRDLGFSPEDRHENIRRIAEVARLMNDAGLIAITAFISPYRIDRRMAREIVGGERFIEVYVNAPLDVCEQRDPKGLYRKARAGKLPEFTGISAPYEAPETPEVVLHTAERSIDDCVSELLAIVSERTRPG